MTQTVTVIVPTFNRANYLGECLDSLMAQTAPLHEILVVDDGSEDATAEIVARYGDRVRYIHKENGGKPSAVNLGLAHASGDLIWIFDDDDVAMPDATANRLAALEATPDAGFVYGPHFLGTDGPDGRILCGRLYEPPHYPAEQFFLEIMKSCFFHLATALVRREHYETLKGMDPALVRGQDYEFQIRLARIARPAHCFSPTFIFRQHAGLRGIKALRHSLVQRSSVFKQYSLSVGLKIREIVPLREFLGSPASNELTLDESRRALLNRVHVMANHGCMLEFFKDVETFLTNENTSGPLGASDSDSISTAIRRGWAYEVCRYDWPTIREVVRQLRYLPNGRSAILALAKGLLLFAIRYQGGVFERAGRAVMATRMAFIALF